MDQELLPILKEEDKLCDQIWETRREKLSHYHICDFDIMFLHSSSKKRRLKSIRACKKWLKKQGMKRDYWLECCDGCPHMKHVTIDSESKILLNVATLFYGEQQTKED